MGGSGIAPSFGAIYGGKLISKKTAVFLFTIFVFFGAVILGRFVVRTLSSSIVPKEFFTPHVSLIIIFSAAFSLFLANLLKVPQSTSWVTVTAIIGAGLHFQHINIKSLFFIFAFWFILPLASFLLTYFIYRIIYPPRSENFWFYEKIHFWKKNIRRLAFFSSLYVAFSIGSNNVANVVGPLAAANFISPILGLVFVSPLFGLGGLTFGQLTIKTMGKEIVPLGHISSSLVSCITATLLIIASLLGVPQSLVQLNGCAILAISSLKHEHVLGINGAVVKKMILVWVFAPLISMILSFWLLKIFKI
jgi:phosphate/sulfate permease